MYFRLMLVACLSTLVLVGCSGPQPLPEAPTPIPTLIPATLPAGVPSVGEQIMASGDMAEGTVTLPTVATPAQDPEVQSLDAPGAGPTSEPPSMSETTMAVTAQPVAPAVVLTNETFETVCVACHNLSGEKKVGPGLAGLFKRDQLPNGKPVNDENLEEYIHEGSGSMPPFPNIEGEQLAELLVFLREATRQ